MRSASMSFHYVVTSLFLVALSGSLRAGGAVKHPHWDGKETIADYAKRTGLEPTLTLDLGDGVKWDGVLIPAGAFIMGSPKGEAKKEEESAHEKQHKVTITQPFYLGKLELTQSQYRKVTGANPSGIQGDDLPVHNVAWKDADDFCRAATKRVGRPILLPTEAQWEYACRAGTTTAYHSGDTIADLDKVGWHGGNSGGKLRPGGQKAPNAWGVFDMHGNVREFVRDLYSAAALSDAVDPTGPTEGDPKNHVVRGGAFTANAALALNCRAATRKPTESLAITGFRVMTPAK